MDTVSMKKIILANWKAYISSAQAAQWLVAFKRKYQPDSGLQVVMAPSYLHLPLLKDELEPFDDVFLAAQDVSPFPMGGYTGSIPADWLRGLADFVLIGHRERRRYFHETVQDAANKVREAVAAGITPILCMDREMAGPQIAALDSSDMERLILAYTPDDAEALEISRSVDGVEEAAAFFGELSGGCPVLYGGGVNAANVAAFMASPHLSGVMTASGCLDPNKFISLLDNAERAIVGKE